MSQYLLNIAARNTGSDTKEVLPSVPMLNNAATGIREDFIEGNDVQDNAVQNQSAQQGFVYPQALTPYKVQQAAALNETEKDLTQKNTETSYFSRHIERVAAEKDNSPVKNKIAETVSFKTDEGISHGAVKNTEDSQNLYETGFVNKTVLKIIPVKEGTKKQISEEANKKTAATNLNEPVDADEIIFVEKQIIQPADKTLEVQHKKINRSDNMRTERITPNQPDDLNKKPVQNREHEAVPRLVIGKITVQILPPKLPAPQKIITKVVQSPSKDSYSKSNKLIFGLGQL
jgi:hypothetical protein